MDRKQLLDLLDEIDDILAEFDDDSSDDNIELVLEGEEDDD